MIVETMGNYVRCGCKKTNVTAYTKTDKRGRVASVTYRCECGKQQTITAPSLQKVKVHEQRR